MNAVRPEVPLEDDACRRDYRRALLSLPSAIMLPNGEFPCSLEDLSLGGARIRAEREMISGDALWLKLDKLRVFGIVRWVKEDEYGVEFEEKLPKTLVMQMQGHAVDPEEYEAVQAMLMARNWVIGDGPAARTRSMRLRDVIGPQKQFSIPEPEPAAVEDGDATGDGDEAVLIRGLRRQSHEEEGGRRWRSILLLALAAIVGATIGIGSLFFG